MTDRRRLAAIERALVADAPLLSSKFAMFNKLTEGERSVGAEQLPARPRPPRRFLYLAALLGAVAAMVALGMMLSIQLRPPERPCQVAGTTETLAHAPVRGAGCPAYPTGKQ